MPADFALRATAMAESKAEFLRRMALRRSRFLVSMILSESFCRVDQHLQIFRIQVFRQRIQLVYKLRVVDFRREELLQRNAEILTNVEQLRHRGKRFPGGNALNISLAVSQIQAHFIFRHTFLKAQLGDPCSDKTAVHYGFSTSQ